ncbi:MAG: D-alanine--D-alanine ligase A [Chloroflexi bacterium]|nr:MAG: D-alanine--D-alanine ligase A [Chloroflexota bacterium]
MTGKESQSRKIKVGVIFGGRSGEHEVSLQSGQSVIDALDRDKYEIVPVGITKHGHWLTGDAVAALTEGKSAEQAALLPDPTASTLMRMDENENDGSLTALAQLDVLIPVLHGTYGEDGTVQGLLELAGLPYVGAGVVGSAVGMDKGIFKHVMVAHDLPILPWQLVLKRDWLDDETAVLDQIEAALPYPVFTKPANLGSSVGISKCQTRAELKAGLDEATRYDRRIVVEQGINVRELEVAVMGNDNPIASIVGEIRPRRDFYDYTAKYLAEPGSDDDSELIIPAEIDEDMSNTVRQLALRAYKAIDCAGLGRVDLLLDTDNNNIYLNEINTIPGFTRISMYPKLWEATGIPYSELLDHLINLALDRHEEKSNLKTDFTE